MSEQQTLAWITASPARGKKSPFHPRVTRMKDGRIRVRQTETVVTFDATFDHGDVPNCLHDRRLWVIGLCQNWHRVVHQDIWTKVPKYSPDAPSFGTEEMALANRFADALIAKLAESEGKA